MRYKTYRTFYHILLFVLVAAYGVTAFLGPGILVPKHVSLGGDGGSSVSIKDSGGKRSATLSGEVSIPGGGSVYTYFKWWPEDDPSRVKFLEGGILKQSGSFRATIPDLPAGKRYYFSACAGEGEETICGEAAVLAEATQGNNVSKSFGFFGEIKKVFNSPYGDLISKLIAATSLIVTALSQAAALAFATPFSSAEIILLPVRLWSLLLSAIGVRKRWKTWGVVYDSGTKRPLDPAHLELVNEAGTVISTAITDLDGRYGFLTTPGTYTIRVKKSNYVFPSLALGHVTRDEIYLNLYFGNYFKIKKEGEVIDYNIPMDPEGFDWNEFQKERANLTTFFPKQIVKFSRISDILFRIGFAVSLLALLFAPHSYNIAVFGLYVVMLVMREVGVSLSKLGTVIDGNTGQPLSYAIVRVYSATLGNQVISKAANARGQFYMLIPNGAYILTIEKKMPDASYKRVFVSEAFPVSKGIIKGMWEV